MECCGSQHSHFENFSACSTTAFSISRPNSFPPPGRLAGPLCASCHHPLQGSAVWQELRQGTEQDLIQRVETWLWGDRSAKSPADAGAHGEGQTASHSCYKQQRLANPGSQRHSPLEQRLCLQHLAYGWTFRCQAAQDAAQKPENTRITEVF